MPARILVCSQAHLGDATLATAVIPALRTAYPQAQIGFLVHPDSRLLVEGNPQISWVHTVEHWHLIRGKTSTWDRIRRHRTSHRAARVAIQAVGYQLAIDLHPYFPNSIPLLARSGIGCLIGWRSAGFGQRLDHAANTDGSPINVMDRHVQLLGLLGITCDPASMRPSLHLSDEGTNHWRLRARELGIGDGFIAVHIGAHAAHRRWPASDWAEVATDLSRQGHPVVLLGHGDAEVTLGRQIAASCPKAINLCGQLTWGELVAAIADCRVLLSNDSAAAHLAAGFERPRICIATGIHDLRTWLRAGPSSVVLSKPVACAPCGRIAGCTTMDCIRGVPTKTVSDAAISLAQISISGARLPPDQVTDHS